MSPASSFEYTQSASIIKENQHALLRIISTQTAINSIEESIHSIEEIHAAMLEKCPNIRKDTPNTGHTKKGMENHTILMGDFSTFLKKERHSPLSLIRDAGCIFERVSNVSQMYALSIYPRALKKKETEYSI